MNLESIKQDHYAFLEWKARNGWKKKNIPNTTEYIDRIKFELSVIRKMKYEDYFLIVEDFISWAKGQGIPVGPGRGCFSQNNRVRVNKFMFKNINDVSPGDLVQSEDGTLNPVEEVLEYDCKEDLLTIQTSTGKQLDGVTSDHEVKAVTEENYIKGNLAPEWIKTSDLKEGDYILEQE